MPFQQYSAWLNVLRHSVSIGSSRGKGECSLVPRMSEPHGREHTGHLWWACARMWGRWAKGKTSPFILEFSSPGSLYLKPLTAVCSWRGEGGKAPMATAGSEREGGSWVGKYCQAGHQLPHSPQGSFCSGLSHDLANRRTGELVPHMDGFQPGSSTETLMDCSPASPASILLEGSQSSGD